MMQWLPANITLVSAVTELVGRDMGGPIEKSISVLSDLCK